MEHFRASEQNITLFNLAGGGNLQESPTERKLNPQAF